MSTSYQFTHNTGGWRRADAHHLAGAGSPSRTHPWAAGVNAGGAPVTRMCMSRAAAAERSGLQQWRLSHGPEHARTSLSVASTAGRTEPGPASQGARSAAHHPLVHSLLLAQALALWVLAAQTSFSWSCLRVSMRSEMSGSSLMRPWGRGSSNSDKAGRLVKPWPPLNAQAPWPSRRPWSPSRALAAWPPRPPSRAWPPGRPGRPGRPRVPWPPGRPGHPGRPRTPWPPSCALAAPEPLLPTRGGKTGIKLGCKGQGHGSR